MASSIAFCKLRWVQPASSNTIFFFRVISNFDTELHASLNSRVEEVKRMLLL